MLTYLSPAFFADAFNAASNAAASKTTKNTKGSNGSSLSDTRHHDAALRPKKVVADDLCGPNSGEGGKWHGR